MRGLPLQSHLDHPNQFRRRLGPLGRHQSRNLEPPFDRQHEDPFFLRSAAGSNHRHRADSVPIEIRAEGSYFTLEHEHHGPDRAVKPVVGDAGRFFLGHAAASFFSDSSMTHQTSRSRLDDRSAFTWTSRYSAPLILMMAPATRSAMT